MIERAVRELNIDLATSFVIGDMTGDVMLGKNAGCKTILVQTGQAGKDGSFQVVADFIAEDIRAATEIILKLKKG